MKHNRRRHRRNHPVEDDEFLISYNPADLLYGIGSGQVREIAGADAERVMAAVFLSGLQDGPTHAWFVGMTVDDLIESAAALVAAGALTAHGLGTLPPEFN